MIAIADLFDRIANPWLRWPLVFAFGIVLVVLAVTLAHIAWGIVQWIDCIGKDTLLCNAINGRPRSTVAS